jgi:nucleoside-diphosphate-sugar epimerase
MKKNQLNKKIGLPRVLIVGCGDVGLRILPLLRSQLYEAATSLRRDRFRVFAVTRMSDRAALLRAAGATAIVADLDQPATVARLARLASLIIYLAPPPASGVTDTRSRHLAALLAHRCRMVYVSTSGVYGDCHGALISEVRKTNPGNPRAIRRVDAELVWRNWARRTGSCLSILRVPGIYASERLPLERLKLGTPALRAEDDVYTNHIHADDLARLIVRTLFSGRPNRVYHAVDDSSLMMGDYFDAVADRAHLPRPPRLPRSELIGQVSPVLLSFMSESRKMENDRIKVELGFKLDYPDVLDGLDAALMKN